ncbi:hypothetical protein BDV27DRAFT_135972 [Aspergillus caelatus]|uniref:Uncharacterized protein n=1 Tax=Aspergillus caelatus TaxID=61420 RepID=A0A5N6ZRP4_9EURO|nr:uncharacterized protein BDV27DRAFT_135972 [Aspergillus caelatus]KAE8359529.1 hypothetical protein BDV27DRAFT_135972 [Aspergillus caelatus]
MDKGGGLEGWVSFLFSSSSSFLKSGRFLLVYMFLGWWALVSVVYYPHTRRAV